MYKLISLANLVNNIDYEKINHIKNEVSYIKDILLLHHYELVDLVGNHNFNLVFCNSHGVILPSSQKMYKKAQKKYKDKELPNLMMCELIHNNLKPNNQYTNMKFFYSYFSTGCYYNDTHYYYKEFHCTVNGIGDVSDVKINDGVCCGPRLKDLFSSFAFLLVKGR